jgi:hypothetical protein
VLTSAGPVYPGVASLELQPLNSMTAAAMIAKRRFFIVFLKCEDTPLSTI